MEGSKKKGLVLLIVIATTLLGQIYIKPFATDFRVSIGIILLTVLLLRFEKVPVISTCFITGLSIFSFRVLLDYYPANANELDLIIKHLPSAVFYLAFGVVLTLLSFRELVSKPVVCLIIISIADIFANVIELVIRGDIINKNVEMISVSIILTGIVRASLSYLLYLSEKLYSLIITSKEQRQKYKEFVVMRANIKSEIFFMQKSMEDIEESMKESYSIYKFLNNKTEGINSNEVSTLKNRVLDVSKGIHEIKKDYYRIISGIGNVIPDLGYSKYKSSEEILEILTEVTEKYIEKSGKTVEFDIGIKRHFHIFEYSSLISILNNLIINSVDAIKQNGWVHLEIIELEDLIEAVVFDNGVGIKKKNINTIFTPGYSTKFDEKTGKMSTGIGLTHVKQIVEKSFDGKIEVESDQNRYTKFKVSLSRKKLCTGGSDE